MGLETDFFRLITILLLGWGSHKSTPCTPYLTAAAAVGMMWKDRDSFIDRLDKVLKTKKSGKKQLRKEIQREMKLPPSGQHVKIIKEHVGLLDDSFEPEDDPKDGETGLEDVIEDPVNERRETDADSKAAGDMETETIKKWSRAWLIHD